jgi:hypothetical protein
MNANSTDFFEQPGKKRSQSGTAAPDWSELERLVDGRLSPDEYRQLLIRIDHHPDGWRKCAMAFLEEQALKNELGDGSFCLEQIETGSIQDVPAQQPTAQQHAAQHPHKNSDEKNFSESLQSPAPSALADTGSGDDSAPAGSLYLTAGRNARTNLTQSHWKENLKLWMTIAACFVGAFFIGVMVSTNWGGGNNQTTRSIPSDLMVGPALLDTDSIEKAVYKDNKPTSQLLMTLNDPTQGSQEFKVPIYDGDKQAEQYAELVDRELPEQIKNVLLNSSFRIQSKNYVVPVTGESGQLFFVPIEQLNIAPSENWKYQ